MNKKRRIGIKIGIVLLCSLVIFVVVSLINSHSIDDKINYGKTSAYVSDQFEIVSGKESKPTTRNVSISEFYTKNENGSYKTYDSSKTLIDGDIITISSGLEFDAFSRLCNENTDFLTYNYKLITNIDYNEASSKALRFIPIGWDADAFSGTFDGQGYEIKNIFLIEFKDLDDSKITTYASMKYISVFSKVSEDGKISNLGIVDTDIIATIKPQNIIGVSPLVGYNAGTI